MRCACKRLKRKKDARLLSVGQDGNVRDDWDDDDDPSGAPYRPFAYQYPASKSMQVELGYGHLSDKDFDAGDEEHGGADGEKRMMKYDDRLMIPGTPSKYTTHGMPYRPTTTPIPLNFTPYARTSADPFAEAHISTHPHGALPNSALSTTLTPGGAPRTPKRSATRTTMAPLTPGLAGTENRALSSITPGSSVYDSPNLTKAVRSHSSIRRTIAERLKLGTRRWKARKEGKDDESAQGLERSHPYVPIGDDHAGSSSGGGSNRYGEDVFSTPAPVQAPSRPGGVNQPISAQGSTTKSRSAEKRHKRMDSNVVIGYPYSGLGSANVGPVELGLGITAPAPTHAAGTPTKGKAGNGNEGTPGERSSVGRTKSESPLRYAAAAQNATPTHQRVREGMKSPLPDTPAPILSPPLQPQLFFMPTSDTGFSLASGNGGGIRGGAGVDEKGDRTFPVGTQGGEQFSLDASRREEQSPEEDNSSAAVPNGLPSTGVQRRAMALNRVDAIMKESWSSRDLGKEGMRALSPTGFGKFSGRFENIGDRAGDASGTGNRNGEGMRMGGSEDDERIAGKGVEVEGKRAIPPGMEDGVDMQPGIQQKIEMLMRMEKGGVQG